jgi:hypothetical protein
MIRTFSARAVSIPAGPYRLGFQGADRPARGCGQPKRADDRKKYCAGLHRARNILDEVNARPDLTYVNENPICSETLSEASANQPAK